MSVSDPLMHQSGPDTFWTTVNAAEARPGVSTPLSQSFWGNAAELAARQAFCDMGVIPQSQVKVGPADENISAVFYGRCAANVDTLRRIADRTPGMSGDGFEQQFLGAAREGIPSGSAPGRIPVVLAKAPVVLARSARQMRAMEPSYQGWWEERTAAPSPSTGALNEAHRRFEVAEWIQLRVTYLAQGIFDNVAVLSAGAGLEGLERKLVSGYGTLVENRIVVDLDAVANDRLSLDTFAKRWGFHGPREGELMSRSWRESTTSLERALERHRDSALEDPARAAARRTAEREEAERELLAALPRSRRPGARLLLALVRSYVPLREVGKAMYVQSIDAARASARALGADWHAQGALADPEDVFFLTLPELGRGPGLDAGPIVEERRARHREYEHLELPRTWTGMPDPIPADAPAEARRSVLEGVSVSHPGVVEGRARVIRDPAADDPVEPGEILVCDTTDPSWVAAFVSAAALVVDIGGPLSHGAIVARELGIPAVVNTGDGSRVIATGDRIRVDGEAGRVEILAAKKRFSPTTTTGGSS
jgi:phosphohistidine swiveling domain-containing protein